MKFLVDEQLPALLADWIISKGYDAIHVFTLGTEISVLDSDIRTISMTEKRVVITKDKECENLVLTFIVLVLTFAVLF
jgi:predicted nuclease of predicted toxin-antitoxin system